MYLDEFALEQIIATARPFHDDLVRRLAQDLLLAWEQIDELEARVRKAQDDALESARVSAAINLNWIMQLGETIELKKPDA